MADSGSPARSGLLRAAQVIIVSSVMFTFISYWRTAAVVLCDLASTAYYIGGIVEQAIGPAAPWFILAVMIFSYAVRSVYLESCSLFVRGGVYRVVKEAMGGYLAKLAVSALMFDFVLTGPISSVSAGQYIAGLGLESIVHLFREGEPFDPSERKLWGAVISVTFACAVTLYFFWQNLKGLHESSDKALRIMVATTIMAVVVLIWCGVTMLAQPDKIQAVPLRPDFAPKPDPNTGELVDPLGWIGDTALGAHLRSLALGPWFSLLGVFGVLVAFGHSILAMSGEETLAQVYREVEAPKMPNFKKAAFVVFIYSLVLTGGTSFLAVMLIPQGERMSQYGDNLLGGLAMNVWGPTWARLLLNTLVVLVGAAILSGAVNTAIIGSNGVLHRVAEDRVMPDWFLKPHPKFGTTHRTLCLIVGLQLFTILVSRGDVILLGEAYAFGVVWSFVFMAMAMVVLRFKDPTPREFKVPLNVRLGRREIPIGLALVLLVLLASALVNLLTKPVATVSGVLFTLGFFAVFVISERLHQRRQGVPRAGRHEHLEQFNRQSTDDLTPEGLGLQRPYRKLVAIRSPYNLFMLEKALTETDPETTDVVVMTAKQELPNDPLAASDLDRYDQQLMTAVVQKAEHAGKEVRPLIVPTNNPLYAVLRTGKDLRVQELIMGASNKYTADEQLEQIGFYWINLHEGQMVPLTVRILSRDRDVYLDLGGGNRIPKISERKARTVAELRAAGIGVDRVLLVHSGSPGSSDLFQAVLTMLDPQVELALVSLVPPGREPYNGHGLIHEDQDRARKLGREVPVVELGPGDPGPQIVRLAREGSHDAIILALPSERSSNGGEPWDVMTRYLTDHAHCPVMLAAMPTIPQETATE